MQATVEIPDTVLRELERLAEREGATAGDVIRRLVEAHVADSLLASRGVREVVLPLIPASETGPIRPVHGSDLDEIISRDHLTARR